MNQVKNFEILQQQQEYLIHWRNEEFETLGRLKNSQLEIVNQMEHMQGSHTRSAEQIKHIYESLVSLQNETEAIIAKYNHLIQYHVNQMQNQLNQLAVRQENELDHVVGSVVSGLRAIDQNIKDMVLLQQETLQKWTSDKVRKLPLI